MFAGCARPIAAMACAVFVLLGVNAEAGAQPAPDYAALLGLPDQMAPRSCCRTDHRNLTTVAHAHSIQNEHAIHRGLWISGHPLAGW